MGPTLKSTGTYFKSNGTCVKSNGTYVKSNGTYIKSNGTYFMRRGLYLGRMVTDITCVLDDNAFLDPPDRYTAPNIHNFNYINLNLIKCV